MTSLKEVAEAAQHHESVRAWVAKVLAAAGNPTDPEEQSRVVLAAVQKKHRWEPDPDDPDVLEQEAWRLAGPPPRPLSLAEQARLIASIDAMKRLLDPSAPFADEDVERIKESREILDNGDGLPTADAIEDTILRLRGRR